MAHVVLLLLLFLAPIVSTLSDFPIIQTSYGAVRGYEYRARNGFVAEIFKKIPYAAPPIGSRRWKKPEPPLTWNYTLDGTFFGPSCAQVLSANKYVTGYSEDCLTLSVYTSKQCRESGAQCPVILYVHGGVGIYGKAQFPDETLATNFASRGVVFVVIQYRVGPFGTLALGDENALPANLGLHDVIASLAFVRAEIHAFGGDAEQVSVMGISHGASMVVALLFSPAVNKPGEHPLFARAIAMSGTAYYEAEEKQVSVSHEMATKLGCVGTAREIMECLVLQETSEVVRASAGQGGAPLPFGVPQLSGVSLAGELMPVRNMQELRDQQKAHMSSFLKAEPTKLMTGTLVNEFGSEASLNDSRGVLSLFVLGVRNVDECNLKYANDVASGEFHSRYESISQSNFLTSALFAQAQSRAGGEVYMYQLDFPQFEHADDMFYTVKGVVPEDANEAWLDRTYSVYFTNFAKGLPLAPDWTVFDPTLMNYYSINKSYTDGVTPRMKFNYQKEIVDYYNGMRKFDDDLTIMKEQVFNAPVQYKSLNFSGGFTGFWESLTFVDGLIFICVIIGAIFLLCCICRCFTGILCCCCRDREGCEHEPLLGR